MVQLKRSEIRVIDEALGMTGGYVLNFSNRTFEEFFEDEVRIEIYGDAYAGKGSSKASRLRAFIEAEDASIVANVLRKLADIEIEQPPAWDSNEDDRVRRRAALMDLIGRIESGASLASTDAIDRFQPDETLDELVAAIQRDIQADKPAVALGHLHTYCAKKFGHLLDIRGIEWSRDEPLNSRVGKYRKALDDEMPTHEMTRQIVRNSIAIFEKFNDVRNHRTLAHDNPLLRQAEARFVFDSVVALLRFVKAVEAGRFET